jgi:hypothetical protein
VIHRADADKPQMWKKDKQGLRRIFFTGAAQTTE